MSLLRRGSSRISNDNFNARLVREKAKTGRITASLAWNEESDLDMHAEVVLKSGIREIVSYRNKKAAGGVLDVDANARKVVAEPVENIFWKKAPAGSYNVYVHLFTKRGQAERTTFRCLLKREGEEDLSVEGGFDNLANSPRKIEVFRFDVGTDGSVDMLPVGTAMPSGESAPVKAMKVARRAAGKAKAKAKAKVKVKAKAKAKVKAKAKAMKKPKAKSKAVAKGPKAKVAVFKGRSVKTTGKLKKEDLVKSKSGKIVSVKMSQRGKDSKWYKAFAKARAEKGYTGFKLLKKGGSFYEKTKEIYSQM